ncbi:MFS transporter [Nocardia terpenica]|uniref:MFS transporter n=1 Tax=Nocardia terpenica TaxID=455432 RepID=UPI0012FD29A4|nr:MFS transporter [Nocardia terpenica]
MDTASVRGRSWGLAGLCIGAMLIVLDANVLSVAVPTIRTALGGSADTALWVLDAYTVVLAALLLSAGSLSDRYGSRRIFVWGLSVFGVASVLCSVSMTAGELVAARALQGLGATLLAPGSLSLIRHMYRTPEERARTVGLWAGVSGVGFASGPVLGGLLVDSLGWRSIFLLNVPVVAVAVVLVVRYVPETPRQPRPFDLSGQILAVVGLTCLVVGLIESNRYGWGSPVIVATLIGGILLLALFTVAQFARERSDRPVLLPLSVLHPHPVRAGLIAGFVYNFGLYGMIYVYSFDLQQLRGYSAAATGLAFLPLTLAGALTSAFVAGRSTARFGARPVLGIGMLLSAIGAVLLMFGANHAPYLLVAVAFVFFSLGTGLSAPAMTTTVLNHVSPERSGLASGLLNAARQIGGAVGVALLGALTAGHLSTRTPAAMALVAAAFLLVTAITARMIPGREPTAPEPIPLSGNRSR